MGGNWLIYFGNMIDSKEREGCDANNSNNGLGNI